MSKLFWCRFKFLESLRTTVRISRYFYALGMNIVCILCLCFLCYFHSNILNMTWRDFPKARCSIHCTLVSFNHIWNQPALCHTRRMLPSMGARCLHIAWNLKRNFFSPGLFRYYSKYRVVWNILLDLDESGDIRSLCSPYFFVHCAFIETFRLHYSTNIVRFVLIRFKLLFSNKVLSRV